MNFRLISLVLVFFLLYGCGSDRPFRIGKESEGLPSPTIEDLKNNSERFNDKRITLTGYFNYSYENVALYHKMNSNVDHAVWVDFSSEIEDSLTSEKLESLSGERIKVQGDFDNKRRGHLGVYIGTIQIDFIERIK